MAQMSWNEINRLDMVDFLASIGIHPKYHSGNTYVYLSPLREEKDPSFKVNRKKNTWKDYGTGQGYTLIDFCIAYYHWTIGELKEKFNSGQFGGHTLVPSHQPVPDTGEDKTLTLVRSYPIRSFYLFRYLWERRIPPEVANRYCEEAEYTFGPKPYYAICFKNDLGGYELRNKFHKYSIAPKAPSLLSHSAPDVAVFEGFFDMLTFVAFVNRPIEELPDLLVLNSVVMMKRCLTLLETYATKHLYLDNDARGSEYTQLAQKSCPGFIDHRGLYTGYNDLNEWACSIGKSSLPGLSDLNASASTQPPIP